MRRTLQIFFLFYLAAPIYGQFNKDSSYSYQDLNKILEVVKTSKDKKMLAEVYVKLADYEGDLFSDYRRALEYYRRALENFKIMGDSAGVNRTNHAIAKRYLDAGFYEESINIFLNLVNIYLKKNDQVSLANLYFDVSKAYKARGDIEKSIEYLQKSIDINEVIKDTSLLTNILFEKIQSFELNNELDSALITSYGVFKINTERDNQEMVAKSLFHIGYINKLKKLYPPAIKYLNKAELLLPYQPYSELRKFIYKELADVYAKSGDYAGAYPYLQNYAILNDSILNKNRLESITNLALKYGSQDKQSSIEVLKIDKQYAEEKNKAQRKTLYILAGGLILVLSSIYFIIKFYDQRISTTKIITEQKEEINHQKIRELEDNIKMSSMRSVIEGQEIERERIAKDLHDSLGGLLSTIKLQFDHVRSKKEELYNLKEYNQAYKLLDTAVEEVRTISRNLQPGSLQDLGLIPAIKDLINRFEGDAYPDIYFQYYEMPEKMDRMIALSVYRIIQELLNNSLKHANAKEILIQINTEDDELVIQYEDDGIGFDQKNLNRKGMGLENVKSRINYMHGSIVIDSESGRGISVLIRIKHQ
ncbi:MAG: sensor histidine kinase [Saprospiraceae bacterium]|nr:sensor histidine kinase [Saprospiraceae bacterium]